MTTNTMTTTPTSGAAIKPVLWVSPEQFANFMDADEAQFGRYIPARKTSAGNFTMPLFAARAPAESVPPPPPECETEAEKRAFAFGWFKALESERMKAESVQDAAARYRLLRRGQHWTVVDGTGDYLRAEALDAAVDAVRKQGGA